MKTNIKNIEPDVASDYIKKVGEQITQRMAELGVSPYRVTQDTGMAPGTVACLTKGDRDPNLRSLAIICNYLGCDIMLVPKEGFEYKPIVRERKKRKRRYPDEYYD